jgi:small subunit ribosomal protein S3
MGKKVNPLIIRISNIKNPAVTWYSKWFAKKNSYADYLREDYQIRKLIKEKTGEMGGVGMDKILIERSGKGDINVTLRVGKPGVIIGRGGEKVEQLKQAVQKTMSLVSPGQKAKKLQLTIKELSKPYLSSEVLAEEAKKLIEKRMPFRKVMKKILDLGKKAGSRGVKIFMSGRLNGVEIARDEVLSFGKMPLHNLRANIDYARTAASTRWGQIGIKVWVYKGEVFEEDEHKD